MRKAVLVLMLGLAICSHAITAPNIHGQSKVLKNAPIVAKAIVDKNIEFVESDDMFDQFLVTLENGEKIYFVACWRWDGELAILACADFYGELPALCEKAKELDKHVQWLVKVYKNAWEIYDDGRLNLYTYNEDRKTFWVYLWYF